MSLTLQLSNQAFVKIGGGGLACWLVNVVVFERMFPCCTFVNVCKYAL